jgi:hypothetical protein
MHIYNYTSIEQISLSISDLEIYMLGNRKERGGVGIHDPYPKYL